MAKRIPLISWGLIIIVIAGIAGQVMHSRIELHSIFRYDGASYYSYLTAAFIKKDLHFTNEPAGGDHFHNNWMVTPVGDDHYIPKMPMGVSLFILPFFLLSHLFASMFGWEANGFSTPYLIGVFASGIFYLVASLLLIARVLRKFYSERTTLLVLLLLTLGTNLYNYAFLEPTLSHIYAFFLYALLLNLMIAWHAKPGIKNSLLTGLVFGLIVLVRPSDIVILTFFFLFGIVDLRTLKDKLKFYAVHWKYIGIIIPVMLLVISPQLIFWKWATGQFIFDTYQGEHFYFDRPHIIDGLFGFRKGWFVYTPLMLIILPGFYFLIKKKSPMGIPGAIYSVLAIYVIFSWWCWWYGGSFSCRPIVESYALLSLPVAEAVTRFNYRKWKFIFFLIVIFLCMLNLFQTYQYKTTILHYDSMTWKAYKGIFRKAHFPVNYKNQISEPDYDYAKAGKTERTLREMQFPYLREMGERRVMLKTADGQYLVALPEHGDLVSASGSSPSQAGSFLFVFYEDNKCFIKTNDKFVCSDKTISDAIIANRPYGGEWELFTFTPLGENCFRWTDYRSKTIRVNPLDSTLVASDESNPVEAYFVMEEW